jgi:hypothetical protein
LYPPPPSQVDLRWRPSLHRFMPMIDGNVGVEYLTVDFPWSQYPGHFLVRKGGGRRKRGKRESVGQLPLPACPSACPATRPWHCLSTPTHPCPHPTPPP